MQDPTTQLSNAFSKAITTAFGDDYASVDPLIKPSGNPKFGDYQANVAMSLAKRVGDNPRNVAQKIVDTLDLGNWGEKLEIAGPGFINIHLKADYLVSQLAAVAADEHLGLDQADGQKVVVDYSGPNVAKEMHVGHLRSTIIGDALARILERCGRTVLRENHLGDWGLPIAMVLYRLREAGVNLDTLQLPDLDAAYRDGQLVTKMDERGLSIVSERNIDVDRLFTDRYTLDQADEAYRLFETQTTGKGVFVMD